MSGKTKNLGGDRLGSGAKNSVYLHDYGMSTLNMDRLWRTTMSAGTLVPCFVDPETGRPIS